MSAFLRKLDYIVGKRMDGIIAEEDIDALHTIIAAVAAHGRLVVHRDAEGMERIAPQQVSVRGGKLVIDVIE